METQQKLQSLTSFQLKKNPQLFIFQGMPTLLSGQSQVEFSNGWPFSLVLPSVPNNENFDLNVNGNYLNQRNSKKPSKNSQITACKHTHLKPFAKSMCYKCYQKRGRSRKAFNCQHTTKANYAKGLCQPCYLVLYFQQSKFQFQKTKNQSKMQCRYSKLLSDWQNMTI